MEIPDVNHFLSILWIYFSNSLLLLKLELCSTLRWKWGQWEKKEREAAVVLVTCIRRQGFQICCVICVLGFGGSKPPVMLSSHHRHVCSFSGQLINQPGSSTFLQCHLKHCVTSMCKHLECKLTAQFALHTAFWK